MSITRSGVLCLSVFLFCFNFLLDPVMAKRMTVEDFRGNYYGTRIRDGGGTFDTAFYEVTSDGSGGLSFHTIMGNLGPLTTTYSIDEHGMLTARSGIIRGALSSDGKYLAIGKFSETLPPQLLFAIKQSSNLSNTVIAGSYDVYLLYEAPDSNGKHVIDSNFGMFTATDGNMLSGTFTRQDDGLAFTGDYRVGYDVAPDGRLILTFTEGRNAMELDPMYGVVSGDGAVFTAAETSHDGAQAYAVGIKRSEHTMADLTGKFYVTDFGYYDFNDDGTRCDAAGSVIDFEAAADGTLSFVESISTCETSPVDAEVTGTFELNDGYPFHTVFDDYPSGLKTGGTLNLVPEGKVFSLVNPTYLGIGILQASGIPEPVTELTADAGGDKVVEEGTLVTLDGSNSMAPEDDIQSYSWHQTGDGPMVELIHPESVQTEFTVPDVDATTQLTFELTVTDVAGNSDTDSITVTINDTSGGGQNQTPSAGTGNDDDGGGNDSCFIDTLSR